MCHSKSWDMEWKYCIRRSKTETKQHEGSKKNCHLTFLENPPREVIELTQRYR